MMLAGMIISAVGGSVFQILPIPILSDMLPPEQLRCATREISVYTICQAYLGLCRTMHLISVAGAA